MRSCCRCLGLLPWAWSALRGVFKIHGPFAECSLYAFYLNNRHLYCQKQTLQKQTKKKKVKSCSWMAKVLVRSCTWGSWAWAREGIWSRSIHLRSCSESPNKENHCKVKPSHRYKPCRVRRTARVLNASLSPVATCLTQILSRVYASANSTGPKSPSKQHHNHNKSQISDFGDDA